MAACKIILALFFGIVAANSDTTTIEIPGIGIPTTISTLPNVAASIISANPTATTFSIKCLEGNDCGVYPQQTQVVGPSTYRIDMEDPNKDTYVTGWVECHISKSAICTESWSGYQQEPGTHVVTQPPTSIGTYGLLITAGVEKLGDTGAKSTGTGSGGAQKPNGTMSGGWIASASPTFTYPPKPTNASSANSVVSSGLLSLAAAVLGGLLI